MAYKIINAQKALTDLVLNQYVNIAKADTYNPDKPIFKFSTNLSGGVAESLAARIDAVLAESAVELGAKADNARPYERNNDGTITFHFKVREFKEGERPFKVWDMKMNPVTDVPNLTGGTVINANFAFYVSVFRGKAFIGLQPTHVQIKEAKVYTGGGAEPTFGAGEGYGDEGDDAPQFSGQSEAGMRPEDF
tara:strand:+ start:2345 stop:2920 length:576 start_codon:yes stop_codon:yes gene_type:complete